MPTPWAKRALEAERATELPLVPLTDPILRSAAEPVDEQFDTEDLDVLCHQMYVTCMLNGGAAIAAPQVGVGLRLVVINDTENKRGVVVANPVLECGGRKILDIERCLSIPDKIFEVPRFEHALIVGRDFKGREIGMDAVGFMARMWQHEADHLDGLLVAGRFPTVTVTPKT